MPTPQPTVDEIVSTLQRSSLPTLLVEGTADLRIYRRIEQILRPAGVDILPCGGRVALLSVFDRRRKYTTLRVAFFADQDRWVFLGVPAQYQGIILTNGYSLENDVYLGSTVEDILEESERPRFNALLDEVCRWFAFEVEEILNGRESHEAAGIGRILNDQRSGLRPEFLIERGFRAPSGALLAALRANYSARLRGKTLFSLLAQVLSAPDRAARHSKSGLVEFCVAMKRNPDHLQAAALAVARVLR